MARPEPAGDAGIARGMRSPYRIRFDECRPDGLIRTSTLLRYAQDLAWVHSDLVGFDRHWYAERGLGWLVRAIELVVVAPIPLGTTLDLSTEVAGFRKVWARRRSEARGPGGELLAWAHTDWVMTDVVRGVPGRVPPEIQATFSAPDGPFEPGRVTLPATPDAAARLVLQVRPQDLDPLVHVNNAAYVDYLEESLLAAGGEAARVPWAVPRRIRLEYLVPAEPGDELAAALWPLDEPGGGWGWRLADAAGRELARARVATG